MSALGPPLAPMLARLARELPRGGYLYEPKWDGFRALVFRDGEEIDIRSRHGRPLARYFPELVEGVDALAVARFVGDGEIVAAEPSGAYFAALMARLHPAASRVERLRRETPARLVLFDLIAVGDEDLRGAPFEERRARLATLLAGAAPPIHLTPLTESFDVARDWLDRFAGAGVDGVVAKHRSLPYEPGRRAMVKVKRERTADCVVAGFRWLAEARLVGSLLLALYDGGELRHIGVATSFPRDRRAALVDELAPLVTSLERHPWRSGFGLEPSPLGRLLGAAGRWDPSQMAMDWVPLRPERVCEVAYDQLDDRRFRHPARFRRWRPDRDPRSCRFDQLETTAPEVPDLLGVG
ncbi:MAG TPA: ATP-dependent DNA ligase [Gaiellaceae bacterium]|nr:ATP-dependent DNA ligase [Gaiellaceae bacterium]